MTEWRKVHDSRPDRPPEVDATSSQYTVYIRKNIEQETVEFETGDEPQQITQWVYDQMTYTQEEYALLNGPQTASLMQAVNDQSATTIEAIMTDTTTLDSLMQAINEQTATIAELTLLGGMQDVPEV